MALPPHRWLKPSRRARSTASTRKRCSSRPPSGVGGCCSSLSDARFESVDLKDDPFERVEAPFEIVHARASAFEQSADQPARLRGHARAGSPRSRAYVRAATASCASAAERAYGGSERDVATRAMCRAQRRE